MQYKVVSWTLQASGQERGNFVLQYKYIPEILEKRDPHRQGHLDAIKKGVSSVWVKHGYVLVIFQFVQRLWQGLWWRPHQQF